MFLVLLISSWCTGDASAMSSTSRVASPGKPVAARADWPEGALDLVNDPRRTDGWNPWFSEWPNDVNHYCFKIANADDIHRLLGKLAAIKADKVVLRLDPRAEASGLGFTTVLPKGNGAAVVFALGSQAMIDQWYARLPETSPGVRQFGVHTFTNSPRAMPPTLTLYVGHAAVDLENLRMPDKVEVVAELPKSANPDAETAAATRAIEQFLATRSPAATGASGAGRGREILRRFVEVNRYWLLGPPPAVRQYHYALHRISGLQEFTISDPGKAPRARRQGVTYSTLLHQIATRPQSVTVRTLREEVGRMRLTLGFDPAVRGACGNGVENSWNGYHTVGGGEGYLVLDASRLVPLEAGCGRLTETFGEFVAVDDQHLVPLAITVQIEDTRYDWRFRVYEPGLWLFDDSHSGDRRLAWLDQVEVNSAPARVRHVTAGSLARAKAEATGEEALRTFLDANRHWLLPSLEARRGLAYDYRQEAPYLERVLFDAGGNLMVRLEASKESPDRPTRQELWLADGRRVNGAPGARFVSVETIPNGRLSLPFPVLMLDRRVQHLAMGLGWECALTRLAREPEAFWVEILPAKKAGQYRLVVHPRTDVRLFTGTMLAFTSWAYMHDLRYDRSEVLCDTATHRPLAERDYAGQTLAGEYTFDDWIEDSSGAAPGRIHAILPHKKDGQDQSLEMEARFRFARPGVWLLNRVESHFRGEGGGSTGTVQVVSATAATFAPLREMLNSVLSTDETIAAVQAGPEGAVEREMRFDDWLPLAMRAGWTKQAREFLRPGGAGSKPSALVGLHRVRLEASSPGTVTVQLDGVSTVKWTEFETEWTVGLRDDRRLVAAATTNLVVRAEDGPTPFLVTLPLGLPAGRTASELKLLSVEGGVERGVGIYHGHGRWFRLTQPE